MDLPTHSTQRADVDVLACPLSLKLRPEFLAKADVLQKHGIADHASHLAVRGKSTPGANHL